MGGASVVFTQLDVSDGQSVPGSAASECMLLHVAFCRIMAISRKKEARSRD